LFNIKGQNKIKNVYISMSWLQRIPNNGLIKIAKRMFSPGTEAAMAAARAAQAVAEAAIAAEVDSKRISRESTTQSYDDYDYDGVNDEYTTLIRNNDRYRSDTHRIWILKSATAEGTSVVLEVRNERDGILSYSDFWHYKDDEKSLASKTFQSLIKISQDIKENTEYDHLPTSLIAPMFKSSTRYVDIIHKEKSGVTSFNNDLEQQKEPDWRKTIYGKKYPKHNSKGTLGDNWINKEEDAKKLEKENEGNPRAEVYKYKYYDSPK
jgi:hypothetical protein